MAKKLFWFSCWETLHYGIEPSAERTISSVEMTMQPRTQPSSTPWWDAARRQVQISESGRTISWNTSTSMTMTCLNLWTTSSQQHSWKEAWSKLVSNRLWKTPTISSNFYKYLWKSPKFSENTSWHLQDGVCRMLTLIAKSKNKGYKICLKWNHWSLETFASCLDAHV